MLTADYLIIGSGAVGMTFADQILTETDARLVIVDRHHMPGGHWNDAYPFVRLHQPSAFYGVGSSPLGSNRIDTAGTNKGCYELASGPEVGAYFDGLMRERFLPSGRVQYFPMCDHLGDGRFVSRLSGEVREVRFRKLVDATYFQTSVPSTHTPAFEVAEGVKLVTPNALPTHAPGHQGFVIVGAGKTGMDVGLWLLQMGVDPAAIRWIVPRDSWLTNRDVTQPGPVFAGRMAQAQARMFEAAAEAEDVGDLFDRLERAGQLLRIDRSASPTMYRGATISPGEVEALATIKDVVRLGRVRRIETGRIVLDGGVVESGPGRLYVDCTAKALRVSPAQPIFDGDRITIQMVRAALICFSAAAIAHIEAAYDDEQVKNDLCAPVPVGEWDVDWLTATLADLRVGGRWASEPALRRWVSEHRLSGAGLPAAPDVAPDPDAPLVAQRIREARPKAEANLMRLVAGMGDVPRPDAVVLAR